VSTKPKSTTPAAQIAENLKHIHHQSLTADVDWQQHDREEPRGARGPPRLLSKVEVCDKVGLDYSYIWKLMHRGKFPRSRLIGDKRVMWLESEVDQWIADLPKVKLHKGDSVEELAKSPNAQRGRIPVTRSAIGESQ
jgi:prophage regulatory protein